MSAVYTVTSDGHLLADHGHDVGAASRRRLVRVLPGAGLSPLRLHVIVASRAAAARKAGHVSEDADTDLIAALRRRIAELEVDLDAERRTSSFWFAQWRELRIGASRKPV